MKKIIELENRWKTYKYRMFMSYIFVLVLFIFLVLFGFFIKFQHDRYSAKKIASSSAYVNKNNKDVFVSQKEVVPTNVKNKENNINFICRKVVVNKLTVRISDNFSSKPLGYYPQGSVFCTDGVASNGLLKTQNGWVSSSLRYSKKVDTNMFVDFGFNKYSTQPLVKKQTPRLAFNNTHVDETKVFESEVEEKEAFKSKLNTSADTKATTGNVKRVINITSEAITPEKNIELLKDDFTKSNDYDIAIKIATFYYDNKMYKDAIKWALNASKADSRDKQKIDSWIIYSKSLYVSGNKDEAIDVLEKYISATNSKYVRDVLSNMKKGVI